jgi:hypothetical protein
VLAENGQKTIVSLISEAQPVVLWISNASTNWVETGKSQIALLQPIRPEISRWLIAQSQPDKGTSKPSEKL